MQITLPFLIIFQLQNFMESEMKKILVDVSAHLSLKTLNI